MKIKITLLTTVLLLSGFDPAHSAVAPPPPTVENLGAAEWGNYEFHHGTESPAGLAIYFAPGTEPDAADHAVTSALLARGFAVAVIHGATYLDWIRHPSANRPQDLCLDLSGALEWTAQALEKRLGFADYRPPILVGRNLGAALAYVHLHQAAAHAIRAGLGFDFDGRIPVNTKLCGMPQPVDGLVRIVPHGNSRAWTTAAPPADSGDEAAYAQSLQGFAASLSTPTAAISENSASVEDLPVVEVSDHGSRGVLVVMYSGDGGWRDIDKQVAGLLAKNGFAVLGVDSLRYFWNRQKPERLGADLDRILKVYLSRWKLTSVILAGYSFGADVLPFAFNRLSIPLQESVQQIVLIAPSLTTDFEIHVSDWLAGSAGNAGVPILPEALRLPGKRVTCIDAAEEADDSLCGQGPLANRFRNIHLPGGHHFDGDYRTLTAKIMDSLPGAGVSQ